MALFPEEPEYVSNRKIKPIWILMKQKMIGWHWHQLDHLKIICTLLQADNHASMSSLNFLWPPCVADADIILVVALWNGAYHYIFALWFHSFFFFSSPNLSCHRLDVYHTSTHGVALVRS